jgi:hypothetical protein
MDVIERLRFKNEQLLRQLIESHLSFVIDIDFEHNLCQQKLIKNQINCELYLKIVLISLFFVFNFFYFD